MRIEGGVSDLLCSHWLQIFLTLTPQTTNFGKEKFIKSACERRDTQRVRGKKIVQKKAGRKVHI
jgi:hypothetical protein